MRGEAGVSLSHLSARSARQNHFAAIRGAHGDPVDLASHEPSIWGAQDGRVGCRLTFLSWRRVNAVRDEVADNEEQLANICARVRLGQRHTSR